MRSLKAIYTIPAHTSSVADVKFYRAPAVPDFSYPFTTGVDTAKAERDTAAALLEGSAGQEIQAMEEDEARRKKEAGGEPNGVAPVQVPLSGMYLASAGYDGFVKLWSADDWQLVKALSMGKNDRIMSVDISKGAQAFPLVVGRR